MKSLPLLLLGLAITGVSHAQFSATVEVVSDYEFRGVSLSEGDPALQASLDYAFDSVEIGAWVSNLDYGDEYDGNFELDLYASYSREVTESLAWGAGVMAYTYPDSEGRVASGGQPALLEIEDFVEAYIDVTAGGFRGAQWYAPDYGGLGSSALYSEINYTHEVGALELTAHLGYSWGDYWRDDALGGGELLDYSLGAQWTVGHFTFAGKLTGTDADDREITSGAFRNDPRLVFAVETTFPWSSQGD